MKYRIKNEKLAELVYSVFEEEDVQRMIEYQIGNFNDRILFTSNKNSDLVTKLKTEYDYLKNAKAEVKISIEKNEIERIREYNPNGWNKYPEVKPPRDGWYLVQWKKGPEGCGEEFPLGVSYWDKDEDWTGIEAFRELPELYQPEEQEVRTVKCFALGNRRLQTAKRCEINRKIRLGRRRLLPRSA